MCICDGDHQPFSRFINALVLTATGDELITLKLKLKGESDEKSLNI